MLMMRKQGSCLDFETAPWSATATAPLTARGHGGYAPLRAAELCLEAQLVNSAASRAYYAMFQAAQVALESAGVARAQWSHPALQAAFTTELIHRRKDYPAALRDHLSVGLGVRQAADYGRVGVSRKVAHRMVRRAAAFVSIIQESVRHGPKS